MHPATTSAPRVVSGPNVGARAGRTAWPWRTPPDATAHTTPSGRPMRPRLLLQYPSGEQPQRARPYGLEQPPAEVRDRRPGQRQADRGQRPADQHAERARPRSRRAARDRGGRARTARVRLHGEPAASTAAPQGRPRGGGEGGRGVLGSSGSGGGGWRGWDGRRARGCRGCRGGVGRLGGQVRRDRCARVSRRWRGWPGSRRAARRRAASTVARARAPERRGTSRAAALVDASGLPCPARAVRPAVSCPEPPRPAEPSRLPEPSGPPERGPALPVCVSVRGSVRVPKRPYAPKPTRSTERP